MYYKDMINKFLNSLDLKISNLWAIMMSILVALSVIALMFKSVNLTLEKFTDRTIGIAVLSGIDASLRTSVYVKLIAVFIIVFLISFLIFTLIEKLLCKIITESSIKIEKTVIFLLSFFSILSIVLFIINRQHIFLTTLKILCFLIVLNLIGLIIKSFSYTYNKNIFNLFKNYNIYILSFFLSLVAIFLAWILFNDSFTFKNKHFFWIIFLMALFYVFYYFGIKFSHKKQFSKYRLDKSLILAGIPLLLIPASIPLSNELQFSLSHMIHISPHNISLIIISFLALFSISIYLACFKRKNNVVNSSRIMRNIYFPIFIATVILFKNYLPQLNVNSFDMFHNGENLIVTQQIFSFNSIPFINIYPTHGISNIFSQILYSLVNGYRPVEVWLWNWIYPIIGFVLFYFLIKKIVNPLFGLLCVLILPLSGIVTHEVYYYSFLIISAFVIAYVSKKTTYSRFSLLWIISLIATIWRVDFGITTIVTSLCILAVIYIRKIIENELRPIDLKKPVFTFIIIFGAAGLLFCLFAVLGGESIKNILIENFIYVKFQAPVQAYKDIIGAYSSLAVLQYFVLPAIAIIYIIYFIVKLTIKKEKFSFSQLILVTLAVISLVQSIRSTQRHGLIEGYKQYFFVFLILCIPFYFLTKIKKSVSIISFGILFIIYILVFPSSDVQVKEGQLFSFKDWNNKETRITVNDSQYKNLVSFLNRSLKEDQTFYDFTNSPMLYVASGRKFIPYLIPNVYNASDPIQQIEVEKFAANFKSNKVPLIIFKQGNGWDALDNVPNEIRSYRIVEFIYKSYKPLGNVDNYQVWGANNIDTNLVESKEYYNRLLKIKKDMLKVSDIKSVEFKGNGVLLKCGEMDPQIYNFLELNDIGPLDANKYWFLKLKYKSSMEGLTQIFFSSNESQYNEQNCKILDIKKSDDVSEALIPIPIENVGKSLTNLRLDPANNSLFEIMSVEILAKDNNFTPVGSIQQNFDLLKLPYIWGTYDSKSSSSNTRILQTIIDSKTLVSKNTPIRLNFDKNIDKSSGDYIHLKIKSDKASKVTLSYGFNKKEESSISFDTESSNKYCDYLVRISSQWDWMSNPIDFIDINSTENIELEKVLIRKGD